MARPEPGLLRVILTPMLLMAAGYLIGGLTGFGIGAGLGILWVAATVKPPRR